MKNITKIAIFSFLLLLAGCTLKEPTKVSDITNRETEQQTNIPSDWKTYRNDIVGFEIRYPQNWIFQEFKEGIKVGEENKPKAMTGVWFGTPESRPGGFIFAVDFWYKPQDLETAIAQDGSQFSDRKEERKNINFNGIDGLFVTVTTKQYPNWILKKIYFSKNDKLFEISNGAIPNKYFEKFFNSFKWID